MFGHSSVNMVSDECPSVCVCSLSFSIKCDPLPKRYSYKIFWYTIYNVYYTYLNMNLSFLHYYEGPSPICVFGGNVLTEGGGRGFNEQQSSQLSWLNKCKCYHIIQWTAEFSIIFIDGAFSVLKPYHFVFKICLWNANDISRPLNLSTPMTYKSYDLLSKLKSADISTV